MTFARGLDGDSRRERRLVAAALGLCLCAAYPYFYQGGGWNQNSRYALVRAIIEQGTLRIDETVRFEGLSCWRFPSLPADRRSPVR